MPAALRFAVVGAECTGKSTLARALAAHLGGAGTPGSPSAPAGAQPTRRVAWVPEWLRQWCDAEGRTPRADEQAGIARMQHQRIEGAAALHEVVVCDTTALMTAVYSRTVFGDRSLEAMAVSLHRGIAHTLLTAIDLPWQGDGLQRDGAHVREPVDDALRELLHRHRIAYSVVAGFGQARLEQAMAACAPWLPTADLAPSAPQAGLFTGLAERNTTGAAGRRWVCDCCVPEAERALRRR